MCGSAPFMMISCSSTKSTSKGSSKRYWRPAARLRDPGVASADSCCSVSSAGKGRSGTAPASRSEVISGSSAPLCSAAAMTGEALSRRPVGETLVVGGLAVRKPTSVSGRCGTGDAAAPPAPAPPASSPDAAGGDIGRFVERDWLRRRPLTVAPPCSALGACCAAAAVLVSVRANDWRRWRPPPPLRAVGSRSLSGVASTCAGESLRRAPKTTYFRLSYDMCSSPTQCPRALASRVISSSTAALIASHCRYRRMTAGVARWLQCAMDCLSASARAVAALSSAESGTTPSKFSSRMMR